MYFVINFGSVFGVFYLMPFRTIASRSRPRGRIVWPCILVLVILILQVGEVSLLVLEVGELVAVLHLSPLLGGESENDVAVDGDACTARNHPHIRYAFIETTFVDDELELELLDSSCLEDILGNLPPLLLF